MGIIISCCRNGFSDEEESLLHSRQAGYGANQDNESQNSLQQQLREEERRLQARERELREVVNSTNDKLIDISMISNSGVVIQSNDLRDVVVRRADLGTLPSGGEVGREDDTGNHLDPQTSNLATILSNTTAMHNRDLHIDDTDDGIHGVPRNGISSFVQLDTQTHPLAPEIKQSLAEFHANILKRLNEQLEIESPGELVVKL